MADINLPVSGEKNWGVKINTSIEAVNGQVEDVDAAVDGLQTLVTNGRLSEQRLTDQIAMAVDVGSSIQMVEDSSDPGLYFIPESFTEDPANPGLYLIGA